MGQWNITIRGTGAHHNRDYPQDADKMAAKFVEELVEAGHVITDAAIVCGSETALPIPVKAPRALEPSIPPADE